ncbi:hypothetical protein COU57_06395 [Candidatus Pacearchaeota archaeon CG10_big_fil_rev_8_21_14_0_10_32_14]|nr:MAG: hypothetical protein COU57_06395 [Candidatus Pacearchaeota archaeon CG10_big_fil_rev_8_21_14_0_10_32_14]
MSFSIKNLVLGIAIFILTISASVYGISTLYGKSPQYDKFCPNIMTYTDCTDKGYNWINNSYPTYNGPEAKPLYVDGGSCDVYTKCQEPLQKAQEEYHRKIFLTALPLGIIILIVGALIFGLESVGAGLMLGGVGVILYGVGGFWQFTEDWMKFVLSILALAIIIWLAYYWNNKVFGKKKK